MSTKSDHARQRAHPRRKGAVPLVGAALAGVVAVTAAWTSAATPHVSASRLKTALPEELSFSANGSVVLIRRDGRRLPFVSGSLRPRGELQRDLYRPIAWSPDGSKLLALRWGYGLGALEVTDETGKVVSTLDGPHAVDGRWSPDGTRIAFVHVDPTPTPVDRPAPGRDHVLFVASSDGRVRTRIAAHVRGFSWSPDGTRLAYAACARLCGPSRAQGAHRLVIADASGRRAPHPVRIPTGAGAPGLTVSEVQWSPDGSRIAFVSRDDAGAHLNVLHRDGSSLHRLADADQLLFSVSWSPDGSRIAFFSRDDGGTHLDVVRPDGSSPHRVADVGPFVDFQWSPDGKRLAMVASAGSGSADVSVVNADGTGPHRIARCRCDLHGFGPDFYESVAWSFDGTRIAYISGRGNTVSTIRPDGTGATVVATQAARGVAGGPPARTRGYWYPSTPLWRPTREQ